jgi:hypothetical protein
MKRARLATLGVGAGILESPLEPTSRCSAINLSLDTTRRGTEATVRARPEGATRETLPGVARSREPVRFSEQERSQAETIRRSTRPAGRYGIARGRRNRSGPGAGRRGAGSKSAAQGTEDRTIDRSSLLVSIILQKGMPDASCPPSPPDRIVRTLSASSSGRLPHRRRTSLLSLALEIVELILEHTFEHPRDTMEEEGMYDPRSHGFFSLKTSSTPSKVSLKTLRG